MQAFVPCLPLSPRQRSLVPRTPPWLSTTPTSLAPPPVPRSPPHSTNLTVDRARLSQKPVPYVTPPPLQEPASHEDADPRLEGKTDVLTHIDADVEEDSDTAPPTTGWPYLWPRGLALLVAVLWSSNFAAVKVIGNSIPVADGALARFAVAALAMAPALARGPKVRAPSTVKTDREHAVPDELAWDGLVCGLWLSLGYIPQAIALQTMNAGKSAFICSLAVVFVPIATSLFPSLQSSQKAAKPSMGAAVLAALGVGLMELGGDDFGVSAADLWALLMMMGFGMGFIENERALEKHPRHAVQLTALQLGVVATVSAVWACASSTLHTGALSFPDMVQLISGGGWQVAVAIAYTGLVTTAGTILLENVILVHMTAADLAVILTTEPLFASAIGAVFLKEAIGPSAAAGGALILCACLLNQVQNNGMSERVQEASGNAITYVPTVPRKKHGDSKRD